MLSNNPHHHRFAPLTAMHYHFQRDFRHQSYMNLAMNESARSKKKYRSLKSCRQSAFLWLKKGPVKLVYVKSVLLYHFKLGFVALHMAVKEFFKTHF